MGQPASLYRREWLLAALLALLIGCILIFTIGYTLEYRVDVDIKRWLTGCRIALFAAACSYLWLARAEVRRLFDPFALCLTAVIAIGAVSGLFHDKEWFTYFRHAFQYAFLLAFYLIGRELALRPIPPIAVRMISWAILCGYAIAIVVYVATPGLHSGSYSFQPNLALLPFASGLSSGSWLMSLAASLIVVVGNKRAVYVGLAIMMAVHLSLRLDKRWSQGIFARLVIVGVTAPVIAIAFGAAVSLLTSWMSLYVSVPTVVDRFTLHPTFNHGLDATRAEGNLNLGLKRGEATVDTMVRLTSARSVEVYTVWNMVNRSPGQALFGHGFGSEFTVSYISPNDYEPVRFVRDQADLAPVQVALTSGLPAAVIFTVMLCGMVAVIFARIGSVAGTGLTIALFSIGSLLDTLLGFHATNPVCWIALGIASRLLLPEFSLGSFGHAQEQRRLQENA